MTFRTGSGGSRSSMGSGGLGSRGSVGSLGSRGSGSRVVTPGCGMLTAPPNCVKGARSHEELIVWQLSYQLKLGVYELIRTSPIKRDLNLHDHRGYVSQDQIVPLQRLSKRASKAASGLIKYLRTATPPNEPPRRQPRGRTEPPEPREPAEPAEPMNQTHEPPEPDEPIEPE